MIAFIGIESGKVYVSGKYRSECFRKLNEDYPTYAEKVGTQGRNALIDPLFPEPLKIVRVSEVRK